MDKEIIYVNSTACNEFMRHRGERDEIAADVDDLQYFNQVATYHFIPLLNGKLPKGCSLFYRSTSPFNGDYFISVWINDVLSNVMYDLNEADKWTVYCDYTKVYFRAGYDLDGNGFKVKPNFNNSNSTQLAAFFSLIGWDLESDSVNQKLYDELTKRYNEMGGFDSLHILRV